MKLTANKKGILIIHRSSHEITMFVV